MVETVQLVKKSNPKIKLYVIGAGLHSPDHERINQLIKDYQLSENITIIPWVDRFEALNYIKQSQFVVSSSRYEGLPFFLIESISLGKACVATNVDGNKDVIFNGLNGTLVGENPEEFAKAIIDLQNNPDKINQYELNAKKLFDEDFDITKNILLLEKLYFDLYKKS